jgi:hypothetical protein
MSGLVFRICKTDEVNERLFRAESGCAWRMAQVLVGLEAAVEASTK